MAEVQRLKAEASRMVGTFYLLMTSHTWWWEHLYLIFSPTGVDPCHGGGGGEPQRGEEAQPWPRGFFIHLFFFWRRGERTSVFLFNDNLRHFAIVQMRSNPFCLKHSISGVQSPAGGRDARQ